MQEADIVSSNLAFSGFEALVRYQLDYASLAQRYCACLVSRIVRVRLPGEAPIEVITLFSSLKIREWDLWARSRKGVTRVLQT